VRSTPWPLAAPRWAAGSPRSRAAAGPPRWPQRRYVARTRCPDSMMRATPCQVAEYRNSISSGPIFVSKDRSRASPDFARSNLRSSLCLLHAFITPETLLLGSKWTTPMLGRKPLLSNIRRTNTCASCAF
jgi:hypothetical protein